ncbi:hypothetical protein QYE76_053326 [Lolium multiflorum]|uniref:Uncharacterized protein n=1 Tax=Lolium multiflorum TaxID=4521 RepID=A0AAD8WJQ1_LOLMU|nr:hypothetical protein QYE76_053326 [Lolium multiflorum]
MENYSLLMGAAAVMKMAVEMAAVSMEKPSGGTSPSGRFHVGAGFTGVAPHYTPPPTTFMCSLTPTDRKSLRLQRAKKDTTIARLRTKIVSLEATVKAQEDQLKEMEDEGEDIQGGEAFTSDDDDFEEDEYTDVEGYEFLEAGEDGFIPIDVDDDDEE